MHTLFHGKFCGYCANFVNSQEAYFMTHLNECERQKVKAAGGEEDTLGIA